MKLSTKGRYATRIMVCLAMRDPNIPRRKQEIAESEGISSDYVEQILIRLKAGGLVVSHRGARGGFTLAKEPEKITVSDVLRASEGPLSLVPCSNGNCERETACVTQEIWHSAEEALLTVFDGSTIADLVEKALKLRKSITYAI
jgi:Rrf2 family protein